MVDILEFQAAIDQTTEKRNLLLGNGFSRACRNDLFAYDTLFETARDQLNPAVLSAFDALGTTDFERVMRAFKEAESLVEVYAPSNNDLIHRFSNDANSLREILANVIASNHPERSNEIPDEEFKSCRTFLSNFRTTYTLNYDILLYWALTGCGKTLRSTQDSKRLDDKRHHICAACNNSSKRATI